MNCFVRASVCWSLCLPLALFTANVEAGRWQTRGWAAPQQAAPPVYPQASPVQAQVDIGPVRGSAPAPSAVPLRTYRPATSLVPGAPAYVPTPATAPAVRPATQPWPSDPAASGSPQPSFRPVQPSVYGSSIVTFDNQSGEPALVRLVGPTRGEVYVPNGGRGAIQNVAAGHYLIYTRYGNPNQYRYTQGDHFDVHGSGMTYSHVTITLHSVPAGNYSMHGSDAGTFATASP